jgi:hypothetical protein
MSTDQELRVSFTAEPDAQRASGRLRDERGEEHGFQSWLGLLTLLEAARARAKTTPDIDHTITPNP